MTGSGGVIDFVRWRPLLEGWGKDYDFQASNAVSGYLQPRGSPALLAALRAGTGTRYAVTGSLAAQQLAPYGRVRLAALYVDDIAVAADALGLRAVDSGANVLLAAPAYDVVFDRSSEVEGVSTPPPTRWLSTC